MVYMKYHDVLLADGRSFDSLPKGSKQVEEP